MASITKEALSVLLQKAFDSQSDVVVDPKQARKKLADDIASAIEKYVVMRETVVTGTSATGGAVTGKGIIQGD